MNLSYITNTDETLAKLITGGDDADYDVISLESAYIKPFIENDLLQKLDFDPISRIPIFSMTNTGNTYPGMKENEYACPTGLFGYTLIAYNKETCPIEIKTVFRPGRPSPGG